MSALVDQSHWVIVCWEGVERKHKPWHIVMQEHGPFEAQSEAQGGQNTEREKEGEIIRYKDGKVRVKLGRALYAKRFGIYCFDVHLRVEWKIESLQTLVFPSIKNAVSSDDCQEISHSKTWLPEIVSVAAFDTVWTGSIAEVIRIARLLQQWLTWLCPVIDPFLLIVQVRTTLLYEFATRI